MLLDGIVDHRTDRTELLSKDAFITSKNDGRRKHETTKGWEILLQWKDGSTTWEALKDIKNCYPLQLAEYAIEEGIEGKLEFQWWVPHAIRKKNRIILKMKSKYWVRTNKFGLRIPKSVEEALQIDKDITTTNGGKQSVSKFLMFALHSKSLMEMRLTSPQGTNM